MKLVLIEWIDSHGSNGWNTLDDIEDDAEEKAQCRSVGWLLSNKNGITVIVPHLSSDETEGFGDLAIPNKCITKRTILLC